MKRITITINVEDDRSENRLYQKRVQRCVIGRDYVDKEILEMLESLADEQQSELDKHESEVLNKLMEKDIKERRKHSKPVPFPEVPETPDFYNEFPAF